MPVECVVGAQWGDEGKGKIIDLLSRDADYVVRFQGGNNAGHTIRVGNDQIVLHLVPSGILHPTTRCVVGNGVVVDPEVFFEEIDFLNQGGVSTEGRLFLSDRAHLIFPFHREIDRIMESDRGVRSIGTTKRGIGPAYADKAKRWGVRLGDLYDEDMFAATLRMHLDEKNALLEKLPDAQTFKFEELYERFLGYAKRLAPYACDSVAVIHEAARSGARVLLEGAQGALLDLDFGTYPFVTSSNTFTGGAITGTGLPPKALDRVIGVTKAYTTRVGEGPFPTEELGEVGERIQVAGNEFGATTGRPRRCGWLDAVAIRYAVAVGGLDALALTKLDVLSGFQEIKVAVAYQRGEERLSWYPSVIDTHKGFEPVYQTFPGWSEKIDAVTKFEDLPPNAVGYISFLEETIGVKISIVSVGPERDQVIFR